MAKDAQGNSLQDQGAGGQATAQGGERKHRPSVYEGMEMEDSKFSFHCFSVYRKTGRILALCAWLQEEICEECFGMTFLLIGHFRYCYWRIWKECSRIFILKS